MIVAAHCDDLVSVIVKNENFVERQDGPTLHIGTPQWTFARDSKGLSPHKAVS